MSSGGCLYIVPTPIGNLADISTRALQTLAQVDLIAAEDTRHSARLLSHYQISTRTISLHAHNEKQRSITLVDKLKEGQNIALISDAGTPLISDPGYELVNICRNEGVKVIALPGPSALVTALSASGLPTDKFTFCGFLAHKSQAKSQQLVAAAALAHTCVFYESPRRISDTVALCQSILPQHTRYVLAKELTKTFETYVSGGTDALLAYLSADPGHLKGEFVLLIYCEKLQLDALPQEALQLLDELLPLLPPKQAAAVVAKHYSLNKKQLYQHSLTVERK